MAAAREVRVCRERQPNLPIGPLTALTYGNGTTRTFETTSRYLPSRNKLSGVLDLA
jgi:hypothetical protein